MDVVLVVVAGLVLVAALAAALWGRGRWWGTRLRPATATPEPPDGPLVLAARLERGATRALVPVLADWIVRGLLIVETSGAHHAGSYETRSSAGPVWHFTAGPRVTTADPVEQVLLGAVFGHLPAPGERITVERDDTAWRDRVQRGAADAALAQRDWSGRPRPRAPWLRVVVVVVVLAALPTMIAAAVLALDAVAAVLLSVAALLVAALAIGLAAAPAHSAAERRYRQAVVDLGEWIRTTREPDPRLAGWAMIWDLPEPWPAAVPEGVARLRGMDRCFLRGDIDPDIPRPIPLP